MCKLALGGSVPPLFLKQALTAFSSLLTTKQVKNEMPCMRARGQGGQLPGSLACPFYSFSTADMLDSGAVCLFLLYSTCGIASIKQHSRVVLPLVSSGIRAARNNILHSQQGSVRRGASIVLQHAA